MRITIDKPGRLVAPKVVRDRLGIRPGDALEIETAANGLRLTVLRGTPRLVREGNLLVFAGDKLDRQATDPVKEHRNERIAELLRQAVS